MSERMEDSRWRDIRDYVTTHESQSVEHQMLKELMDEITELFAEQDASRSVTTNWYQRAKKAEGIKPALTALVERWESLAQSADLPERATITSACLRKCAAELREWLEAK